jgi:tRNA A-37 threonylcarbamoyl transferase component Bud32
VLQSYLLGRLPGDEFESVESHVSSCDTCCAAIRHIPADSDELTSQLSRIPSQTDFGDYELILRLGRGGMGNVYKARHRVLKQDFALKLIRPELQSDPHFAARFEREIRSLGKVTSPHVVQSVHAGEWHGTSFVVMELVDGSDLETLVRQQGVLSSANAAEVIAQMAVGLDAIHDQGLVHRDLHPGNVLFNRQGLIKIGDLGLVTSTAQTSESIGLTDARDRVGAEAFMAPEQRLRPDGVTSAADLFSLGCVWHYLLTGRALARDPLTHCVTRLDDSVSALPRSCRSLIRQLLNNDPDLRPQSLSELVKSLTPQRRKARLTDLWSDTAVEKQATSKVQLIALSTAAVLAAALGIAVWQFRDQPPPPNPYHELAERVVSVPYMQAGPFARPYFFEAFPEKYTLELVDDHNAMLANGRLVTFWYFDCVGDSESTLIAVTERSPRPSTVVELIPGTHKVGIWSVRDDVWEGDQRPVIDRATAIFYVYPDLTVEQAILSAERVQQGQDIMISLDIRNRGTVDSNPGTLRTYLNPGQQSYVSGAIKDIAIPELKPGETCHFQVTVHVPENFPTGEAFVSVFVDADDTTNERDEQDVKTWVEGAKNDFRFVTKKDPKGVPPGNNRTALRVAVRSSN